MLFMLLNFISSIIVDRLQYIAILYYMHFM